MSIMDAAFTQRYCLSDNGFLPPSLPLARLPDPYYAPWETIIVRLPALLRDNDLRNEVSKLATLSTDRLTTEGEWRRAYLILAFLTHGYIWGEDKAVDVSVVYFLSFSRSVFRQTRFPYTHTQKQVLPPCIAVPLLAVSAHLELPPVATYAALNLWNFTTTTDDSSGSDNGPFGDLDRLRALHTFTDTESESWFYVVSVAMECRAAKILPILLGALEAAAVNDCVTVTVALCEFVLCIQGVGVLLDRMHERCDPTTFFFQIRPYLAGSKNMAAQGLPNGVFYDEGNGRGQWRQLRGGSNGQSSLIQFFDIVLGVEHTSNGCTAAETAETPGVKQQQRKQPEQGFHREVRGYMPGPHRRFLEHVAAMPSLREFVAQTALVESPTDAQRELSAAFQDATKALAAFRNKHLAIVSRYIIIPSRQKQALEASNFAKARGLAADVSPGPGAPEMLTGTGGTELMPFLKQTRDETLQAGMLVNNSPSSKVPNE